MSAHANNVLLFTDGEDSARDSQEMRQLSELVSGLLLEAKARNKFFVIFCGTDGDALTKDIAKTFDSPIIHTQSADFMSAIKDPEKLKSYAAERGLFTVKYSVHLETGPKTETNTHLIADLSGQIVALDPVEINPNSTLSITIAQGDQTLVDSKKKFYSSCRSARNKSKWLFEPFVCSFQYIPRSAEYQSIKYGIKPYNENLDSVSLHQGYTG
ncbi:hypothetical protein SC122_14870 [Legionella pneumophila serogroup 1]|uniref:hypothetical protein n=1 Tax=Legionella pneumophila TaxID=446 RepID=UPI000484C14F|nr:hypothetical protein [Legionella pneumophila]SNV17450.1 Uncharacterised protein [Legionella pneumophila]HAT8692380.1 hypothetical protein [Legionella pneumophila]HAU0207197.1 hypothetical protein [Legionella pneumophila]HAU0256988.1 hypothetical protein [Legionella pneumophila]HAU0282523.1 hypothetical protein [Legionella pneumophila]